MIKFDGTNCLFLPSFSRNSVSTYNIKKLFEDSFTIRTRVKIDWDKLKPNSEEQVKYGIVCLNGMDMGIFCNIEENKFTNEYRKCITAEVWTNVENGTAIRNDLMFEVKGDNKFLDIEFRYGKDKFIELLVDENWSKMHLRGDVVDYSESFLWIGCCNNNKDIPENLTGNLYGEMKKVIITSGEKSFIDCDFTKDITMAHNVTDYKVYDYSGNANHLLKKFINDDGQLIIF